MRNPAIASLVLRRIEYYLGNKSSSSIVHSATKTNLPSRSDSFVSSSIHASVNPAPSQTLLHPSTTSTVSYPIAPSDNLSRIPVAPSQVLVLTGSSVSARELRNLVATLFPIDTHELRIVSITGFLRLIHEFYVTSLHLPTGNVWDNAILYSGIDSYGSSIGSTASPFSLSSFAFTGGRSSQLSSRFESRAALRSIIHRLPLEFYRPPNAPFKYLDIIHRYFEQLSRAGISPEEYQYGLPKYVHLDTKSSTAAVPITTVFPNLERYEISRHNELARAYREWVMYKSRVGILSSSDAILSSLNILRKRDYVPSILQSVTRSGTDNSLGSFSDTNDAYELSHSAVVSYLQKEIRHVLCMDIEDYDLGILRILHAAFGTASIQSPLSSTVTDTVKPKETAESKKKNTKTGRKTKEETKDNESLLSTHYPGIGERTVELFVDNAMMNSQDCYTLQAKKDLLQNIVISANQYNLRHSIDSSSTFANDNDRTKDLLSTGRMDRITPFQWYMYPVDTLSSQSSSSITIACQRLNRANKTLDVTENSVPTDTTIYLASVHGKTNTSSSPSTPKTSKRKKSSASLPSTDTSNQPPESIFQTSLYQEMGAQYAQALPTTLSSSTVASITPPGFVECIGLQATSNEVRAIAQSIKSLLTKEGLKNKDKNTHTEYRSIAVLCKSNTVATEIGAALQNELSSLSLTLPLGFSSLPSSDSDNEGAQNALLTKPAQTSKPNNILNIYSDGHAELSRVPEVRWILAFLGVLVQPRDQSNWYTLASSPLYNIPLPTVADWVRSALADPEQAGSVLRVIQEASAPKLGTPKDGAPASTKTPLRTRAAIELNTLASTHNTWGNGWSDTEDEGQGPVSTEQSSTKAKNLQVPDEGKGSDSEGAFGVVLPPIRRPADALLTPPTASSTTASSPSGISSPLFMTVEDAARQLLDDLRGFTEEQNKTGSVAKALAWYIRTKEALAPLREATTPAQADAAAALAALLTLIHRLERRQGSEGLKSATRRLSRQNLYEEELVQTTRTTESETFNAILSTPTVKVELALDGLAPVFEAVKGAVYAGRLRYVSNSNVNNHNAVTKQATGALVAAGGEGDVDEEIIDVVDTVSLFKKASGNGVRNRSAAASLSDTENDTMVGSGTPAANIAEDTETFVKEEMAEELVMNIGDAASQQTFEQISCTMEDNATVATLDNVLTTANEYKLSSKTSDPQSIIIPLQGQKGSTTRPFVVVTTFHRGVEYNYDVIIFPNCTNTSYPGRYLSDNLPLPLSLFTGSIGVPSTPYESNDTIESKGTTMNTSSTKTGKRKSSSNERIDYDVPSLPILPYPNDRLEYEAQSRAQFLRAMARAREGVLFFCPGVPTAESGVSTRTSRSKWIDYIFGAPPLKRTRKTAKTATEDEADEATETVTNDSLGGATTLTSSTNKTMMAVLPSLSFSSLSDYDWCPWKFKLRKIDKLVPLPAANVEYGKALHASVAAVAELVYRPLYTYLEDQGVFTDYGLDTKHGTAELSSIDVAQLSLQRAIIAIEFMQRNTNGSNDIKKQIIGKLPTMEYLTNVMLSAYKDSWVPMSGTESVTASATSKNDKHRSNTAWCAAYPTESNLSMDILNGSLAQGHSYIRKAVDTLLLDAEEIRAYEPFALQAIHNFANRELTEIHSLLTDNGKSYGHRLGNGNVSVLALVEQYFQLSIPINSSNGNTNGNSTNTSSLSNDSTKNGMIHLSGYIDRIDVQCLPPENSGQYRDGSSTYETNIREYKSGQQWKRNTSDALKDKLRTLQPDIYGMAVKNMITNTSESSVKRNNNRIPPLNPIVQVSVESIESGNAESRLIDANAIQKAQQQILTLADRIRLQEFSPTPSEIACKYCGFSNTCHSAYGRRPSIATEQTRVEMEKK